MSENVKAAMTAEEWNEWRLSDAVADPRTHWRDAATRHAEAAKLLIGQPFGFSREDVEFLRGIVLHVSGWNEDGERDLEGESKAIKLAARIEALLPPESPTRDDGATP